jgi:hypothetical protein
MNVAIATLLVMLVTLVLLAIFVVNLWWLADPQRPAGVGEVMAGSTRDAAPDDGRVSYAAIKTNSEPER